MGPVSYQNWKAKLEGHPPKYAIEFPLFTDAHITGQIEEGYGPYQFFNTIAIAPSKTLTSSIILRVENHLPAVDISKLKMIKTDTDHYHGGWLSDEVAALLSLCLGIRAKAGGSTRRFELNGDPRGRPEHYTMYSNPVSLPKLNRSPILPFSFGPHLLNDAIYLQRFPEISAQETMALVRAARLYQDAIWVSESEPALAWLMFVSSIETAADYWRKEKETPIERLRASKPQLEKLLLGKGDKDFVNQVAGLVSDFMGATKKFIDFILSFLPTPPKDRPAEFIQFSWDKENLKKALCKIYDWRYRSLHGGIPFPLPMCEPPFVHEGRFAEKPIGVASQAHGATWVAEDTPMLLHTFEYIVRNSLLSWWNSMIKN